MITRRNFLNVFAFFIALNSLCFANRFVELDQQKSVCKNCVLFHSIVYPDSQEIYLRDLKSYLKTQSFQGNVEDSILWDMGPHVIKMNPQKFALYMAVTLCWQDTECKEILWNKRNGSIGRMSVDMYRTIAFLMPERLPQLLSEFKKYPMFMWRNYSLQAFSYLSMRADIDSNVADTLKNIVWNHQKVWEPATKLGPEIVKQICLKLDARLQLQRTHRLTKESQIFKDRPIIIETILENLIEDEKWDRICPEFDQLLKDKIIQHQGAGDNAMWIWIIQKKCGLLTSSDQKPLRQAFLSPFYADLLLSESLPTPVLNKLLHDYAQELLAEQRKKNPVKWRIWPEIVGPRR